ncbi:uncharacterized protein LACBIDRAFT_294452 [Laccaria bicolor S238N-H82]|uniref:Predicted protein n=1 Tax=Laccaria bicolor (strain S238N-H82 / ATCC MYA-4686) TaxID=486041 RepID=B0DBW6_LACBS|nr:uncharacterized protein LACBIDRAFT_294452 [Laccaria bicolor S238N-H82]EDR07631.1 predicted protein [Laccaria bicolor S238N-H82]|eukprot:XP_001881420.1 predicted protein [Laccaria bicolor S238N-H82]
MNSRTPRSKLAFIRLLWTSYQTGVTLQNSLFQSVKLMGLPALIHLISSGKRGLHHNIPPHDPECKLPAYWASSPFRPLKADPNSSAITLLVLYLLSIVTNMNISFLLGFNDLNWLDWSLNAPRACEHGTPGRNYWRV